MYKQIYAIMARWIFQYAPQETGLLSQQIAMTCLYVNLAGVLGAQYVCKPRVLIFQMFEDYLHREDFSMRSTP